MIVFASLAYKFLAEEESNLRFWVVFESSFSTWIVVLFSLSLKYGRIWYKDIVSFAVKPLYASIYLGELLDLLVWFVSNSEQTD